MRSKKAAIESSEGGIAGQKWFQFLAFGIATGIVMLIALFYVYGEGSQHEIPKGLEEMILAHRFSSTYNCFAYVEPLTGRTHPGVIDLLKFTENQMKNCYASAQYKSEFNLTINQLNLQTPGLREDMIKKNTFNMRVLVKTGDEFNYGILKVDLFE